MKVRATVKLNLTKTLGFWTAIVLKDALYAAPYIFLVVCSVVVRPLTLTLSFLVLDFSSKNLY